MFIIRVALLFFISPGIVLAQAMDTVRLSLDDAIVLALKSAPEPRLAQALLDQTEGATMRSLAPPPPQLSVEYGFIPSGSTISEYGERSIAIDQTLPSPWSWFYAAREGTALREQAHAEAMESRRIFVNAVTIAYYRLAAQRHRTRIAAEQHRGAASMATAAEARFRAGDIAQTEVLMARALLSEADVRFGRQRTLERQQAIAFASLLGSPGGHRSVFHVPSDSLILPDDIVPDTIVLGAAIARSPRILAAQRALDAARAASSLATADIFPSFSVGVMDQRQMGLPSSYGVRIGMSIPLWFAFDQRQAIRVADARVMEAEARLRIAELSVRATVLSTLEEYLARAQEAARYQHALIPEARTLVDLTERAWTAGEADFLDVVQARRHHAFVADDALTALLSCLEMWTEIQSLLNMEKI